MVRSYFQSIAVVALLLMTNSSVLAEPAKTVQSSRIDWARISENGTLDLPELGLPSTYLPNGKNPANAQQSDVHLVVKLSTRRVYVHQGEKLLASYPIAVGKPGWETPLGTYQVLSKEKNPIFKSFKSGRIVQPGPENPLGVRWIGIWTDGKTQLGFHGTNEPELIGQAVSHGCIRMWNKDVTALYEQVELGTPVTVKP